MVNIKKNYSAIFIIGLLTILISWMFYSYFSHSFIYDLFQNDTSKIIEYIQEYNNFSYIIFILLIVLECVFAPFPPLILYIAGGALFGGFIGGVLALIGNLIGAAIAFQISKHFGREFIKKRIPNNMMRKFDVFSEKYGVLSIFILRINPLTSSDLFSYIAGLTKIKFWKFLVITTIALAPIIFIQTFLGEQLQSNPIISFISIIGGVIYLIGFFIFYFWFRRRKTNTLIK